MENKTELIERLRKIANELENDLKPICIPQCKPEFEVGKWYKCYGINSHGLVFLTNPYSSGKIGYGIDGLGNWTNEWHCKPITDNMQLATESEVLEALTKEAVKRGLVEGAKADLRTIDALFRENYTFKTAKYRAGCFGFSLDGVFIMQNGIWATVIEERSLEEWYNDYRMSSDCLVDYTKKHKTELIEILNNLPND